MKIEVAKSDLENALEVPRIAVGSGDGLNSHYLIRVKAGMVEVLTYDSSVFGYSRIAGAKVDADEGEAVTVDHWRLDKWLAATPAGKPIILESGGDGVVSIRGGRSKLRLRSLDPKKWRYWDGLADAAKEVGRVAPASLSRALTCSRWFVGGDDTNKPELCQVEAVKGVLWATDRRALTSVTMPRLPELAIRVPGTDVSKLVKFLDSKRTQEELSIEIREAERAFEDGGGGCAIFCRPEGSYLGVMRPTSNFPALNVDSEAEDQVSLKLVRDEFNEALEVLLSGAPKGFPSVTFTYDATKGVTLKMPCEAGDVMKYTLQEAKVENGDKWLSEFTIDYAYLKGIADTFKLTELDLGVNERGRSGYVSFRYSDEEEDGMGNRYYSMIVWRS